MIPVRGQSAFWTLMPALAERLGRRRPAEAGLRSAPRVNLYQSAPGAFSLVRNLVDESRPPGIADTFGEHPPRQSPDVQIFDGDGAEIIDQPAADLVVKIGALILNMSMRLLQKLNRFPA